MPLNNKDAVVFLWDVRFLKHHVNKKPHNWRYELEISDFLK